MRLLQGRLAGFPGEHRRARIVLREDSSRVEAMMHSDDGAADVRLEATASERLASTSRFGSLEAASKLFAGHSVGYSATRDDARLDGLQLHTLVWRTDALDVLSVFSSYYADETRFPRGSVEFDSVLIMRDIPHEWRALPASKWEDRAGASVCDHQCAGKESECNTRSSAQRCRFSK